MKKLRQAAPTETLRFAGRSHTGPPIGALWWIHDILAEGELSRAEQLELARVMERALVLLNGQLHPPMRRRGARDKFMTFRDAGLVNHLVLRRGVEEREALDVVAGNDKKKRERIYRYLLHERKSSNFRDCSHDPRALERAMAALKRRPKVHRIK